MGEDVAGTGYTREQRQRYREKVRQNLDVFEQMLSQSSFDFERPMTGMEIELNLVDQAYQPRMSNAEVLTSIADPGYQTELGRYNIELNVPPRPLPGDAALELEVDLRRSLNRAEGLANQTGAHIVAIGILPTVMPEHFSTEWMSANTRYAALNEAVFNARGEDVFIDIEGPTGERLATYADSIAPESACASVSAAPADGAQSSPPTRTPRRPTEGLRSVPVGGELLRAPPAGAAAPRCRRLGGDGVGVGGQPLPRGPLDVDEDVLAAGVEDGLVEGGVAGVGAHPLGAEVLGHHGGQDADRHDVGAGLVGQALGPVQAPAQVDLELERGVAGERTRGHIELDVVATELGLVTGVGDARQHLGVGHARLVGLRRRG